MRIGLFFEIFVVSSLMISIGSSGLLAADNGSLRRVGAKIEINGAHSGAIYGAGGEVVVNGSTPGDARLMGAIVRFLGRVGKDLWIVGGDLDISGEVTKNLRAMGGKILLNSFVGGKVSLRGADIIIEENTAVSKKFHASGDKIIFKGASIGMVKLEGREVIFSGAAKSGLKIRAASVKITDNARIIGDIIIHTIGEPEISDRARIEGKVHVKSLTQWEAMRRSGDGGLIERIVVGVLATLCAFLTGVLTIVLARGGVEKTIDTLVEEPVRSGIWGVVGLVAIPLIAAFLIMTVLGSPLAAALLMTVPLIGLLSLTGSGFAVGEWIFNRAGDHVSAMHRSLSLLAGLLLIAVLSFLPYIGGAILALAVIFGAGALFLLFKDRFGEMAPRQ